MIPVTFHHPTAPYPLGYVSGGEELRPGVLSFRCRDRRALEYPTTSPCLPLVRWKPGMDPESNSENGGWEEG